jgi:hypothetical protein
MSKQVAAVVLAVLFGITCQAVAQQGTRQDIARILRIPPEQRSEALWVALAAELQRVASESHARIDAINAGRRVPSLGEDHGDYYRSLVEAVGQWRDPRALRPLISAGGGMLATQAIVRFGEAAVPPLIEAARTGHSSQRGGVLLTLGILLEGFAVEPYDIPPTPLSSAAREQILQLARGLLRPATTPWPDLPMVAGLALATRDEALREQVELLAREPGAVAQFTGLGDGNEIARLQNSIRNTLDRYNR